MPSSTRPLVQGRRPSSAPRRWPSTSTRAAARPASAPSAKAAPRTSSPSCPTPRSTARSGNMMASFFGCTGQRCLAGANLHGRGRRLRGAQGEVRGRRRGRSRSGPGLDESVNIGPDHLRQEPRAHARLHRDGHQGRRRAAPRRPRHRRCRASRAATTSRRPIFDNVHPRHDASARKRSSGRWPSIIRVKDLDEAIKLTNASPFGNAASIYTTSGRSARNFWYKVQAGNIGVNLGIAAAMAYFPFAGQKDSLLRHDARPGPATRSSSSPTPRSSSPAGRRTTTGQGGETWRDSSRRSWPTGPPFASPLRPRGRAADIAAAADAQAPLRAFWHAMLEELVCAHRGSGRQAHRRSARRSTR